MKFGGWSMRFLPFFCFPALFFVLLAPHTAAAGPIYMYKEKDGCIKFTNREPPAGTKAEVFTGKHGSFAFYRPGGVRGFFPGRKLSVKLSRLYSDVIERASRVYGLERNLVRAVIHVESYFDPAAVSPKGARGLMQLMPDTADMLGVRHVHEVEENIMAGAKYLSFLLRKYEGNLKLALAAYNAGEASVEKFNGIPPFRETVDYVDRVLQMRKRYETIGNG